MNFPALPFVVVISLAAASILFWLFVSAAFLLWGARLAGIERRSFGRAFGTILLGGAATALLAGVLSAAPVAGTGLGVLLGLGVSSLVMMALFDTTFGKALAANLLAWVLPFLVAAGLALLGLALFGLFFMLTA
jgi:hypothetical protein